MDYIRIFLLKISVFYRVENPNGTSRIILSYYIDPDVLNQLVSDEYSLISGTCDKDKWLVNNVSGNDFGKLPDRCLHKASMNREIK